MKLNLTKQECSWLAALAKKEKNEYDQYNKERPCGVFELRRDNMAALENKINAALQREIKRESRDAR